MKKVAVIIVHYKNPKETEDTVSSLQTLIKGNISMSVYTVNNSQEKLNIPYPIINNKENLGFAQGCNIGAKQALREGCQYILFLNSDTIVSKDLLIKLVASQEKDDAAIISPKIYFAKDCEYHKELYKNKDLGKVIWYAGGLIDWNTIYCSHRGVDEVDEGRYDQRMKTDFATGCCMMVKSEIFEQIGYFDPKYFVYFEDVDLSIRVKKKGFKVIYEPNTHIWHKNALSSDKPGSPIHVYFQTRNRYYFALKFAPLKTRFHIIKELITNLRSKDYIRRSASIDALTGKMDKGSFQNL